MLSYIIICSILVLSIVWFLYRRNPKVNSSTIPGVRASHPEMGNFDDIKKAGSLHEYLSNLHKRFGPVVSFYWGKQMVVSAASPEAFHDMRRLFDRPVSLFAQFEPLIGSNSIQYANGDIGRYRRKHHYDSVLSIGVLRTYFFDIFKSILCEKLNFWRLNEGQTIALHNEMLSMAIQSITLAAFGLSISPEDGKNIEKAYNKCWYEMEKRVQGETMNSTREVEFNRARDFLLEKVSEIIYQRRQRSGTDNRCFIDYLLGDSDQMPTDRHIGDEIITMLVGGFHTTGNLLTWVFYYLAKHKDIQQRLYEELVQSYDTELPSVEQIEKLSYLANIISETLRVSVLAPWAARVSTDEPVAICGHLVPAGTPIIQALGVVLQDESIWTNPTEFDPDRFKQENRKKFPALAFSPFGFAGKRICPGYRFAEYEAALFVAGIMRTYEVVLVDPSISVVPVHRLVTSPKDEIYVKFIRRNFESST